MTLREKMLAVYQRKNEGEIPLAAYAFELPRGSIERKIRNIGCGLVDWHPTVSLMPLSQLFTRFYESEAKDVKRSVKTIWEGGEKILVRMYDTPLGSIFEKIRTEPGYHSEWRVKHLIDDPRDYEVVKFIIQNTIYRQQYDLFLEAQDKLGDDGVVLAVTDRSPWQKMLIELVGSQRLFLDLQDHKDLVEDLLFTIEKKQEEAYAIIAGSPAEVVWIVDNLTGDLTSPRIFEKYVLPFYNRQGKLLHQKNKILAVHLDGRLKCLKRLIQEADIDVVESLTLPGAGGDLSIGEASGAWKDKSIVANIPASLCFKDKKTVQEYVQKLLLEVSPRKSFMWEVSEDLPYPFWKDTLLWIVDAMQNQ